MAMKQRLPDCPDFLLYSSYTKLPTIMGSVAKLTGEVYVFNIKESRPRILTVKPILHMVNTKTIFG